MMFFTYIPPKQRGTNTAKILLTISTITTANIRFKMLLIRFPSSALNVKHPFIVDRAYIYNNSVDNQLPHLLYRTIDGDPFKQYTDDQAEWAKMLLYACLTILTYTSNDGRNQCLFPTQHVIYLFRWHLAMKKD